MSEKSIFIVSRPGEIIENVIIAAPDRARAKLDASVVLGGSSDGYIVDLITKHGSQTVFMTGS